MLFPLEDDELTLRVRQRMSTSDHVPMNPEYMDYAEHERTYRGFTFATKWGSVAVAVVLILMAFFLL
jgi:hypothetical protein